jgi:hypothetical protein
MTHTAQALSTATPYRVTLTIPQVISGIQMNPQIKGDKILHRIQFNYYYLH